MGICMQHANSATPAAAPACSLPLPMASVFSFNKK